ncbi:SDR family NAD(P)-dependent oxidoreductase [Roseovarius sp. A21]|uniref:SDR family NAD(P)-dependent oxidoreductase n=1 Tax=Roseovarius bejariae TaxID=2576383 RepID=A0A844CJ60_9RHOB|nr:SDR family NAD(P)-dependent oxidoreductase [Roseovarius bejariae]MRU14712.1 SDR family NAD(P)-dependent oxidoreductase [Roseovarius bejariae]
MSAKTILITGCSTGIGLDAAHTLRARGWRVFAACRKAEDCDRLRTEGFDSPRMDYNDEHSLRDGLAEVLDATGGTLDALFNNGAYAIPGPVEDIPTEALRTIFQSNLIGWHDLTRQVIPVMRAQGHGRIVQCSSVLGLVAMKWRGAYVSTKFALEGLTDALRLEMAETGIKVSIIDPGPIETDFRKNAIKEFERWIDWENSARADQYRDNLLTQLYEGSSSGPQWPASAVTRKLIHALDHPRPKARYYVTAPTHAMGLARRALPARALDWLVSKG